MSTTLHFTATPLKLPPHILLLGPCALLSPEHVTTLAPDASAIASIVADGLDKTARLWAGERSTTIAALEVPTSKSRWLGTVRGDLVQKVVQAQGHAKEDVQIYVFLQGEDQALSVSNALARSFPLFNAKTPTPTSRTVSVTLVTIQGGNPTSLSEAIHTLLSSFADAIRQAARLVDTPTSELNTTALVQEFQALANSFSETVKAEIISGDALIHAGLRTLHGVGRAATAPPALVCLTYSPKTNTPATTTKVALVGKGIVYDTGGLSLKPTAGMLTMKSDMGGCAALLHAFRILVESQCSIPVVLVACIAENAIGPLAQRPDDIVVAHSGKTIELNNTDAEGRLVLADGVSWVAKLHNPTHMVDLATLTGAQSITTGVWHGSVMSASPSLESTLLAAGQKSGDWAFPIIYAPEILMPEYDSKVADMRNYMTNKTNAASACAGHFVEAHLPETWKGEWAHIDIAGPSFREGRGTGFGVGLIVEAVRALAERE